MAVQKTAGRDRTHGRSLARRAILALDRWLRRRNGIVEYSSHPQCLYRLQIAWLDRHLQLRDGTQGRPGDRIILLHLWNEHIPPYSSDGATIGWARRITGAIDLSLGELCRYLAARPQLDDIVLIGMAMNVTTAQKNIQLVRFVTRLGFEAVAQPPGGLFSTRLRQLGDNIWSSFLVLAHNPAAFRWNNAWRTPLQVFASREMLQRRYGNDSDRG